MDVGAARRVATAASDGLAAAVLGRFRGLREALAGADGYAVVDSACGAPAWLAALREAAEALPSSLLRKNSTLVLRPGSDTPDVFAKRGIDEAEVSLDAEVQAASPVLAALATDTTTATALAAALPAERFAGGAQAIKLQVSRGGGACFPLHHDAADDGRELTVIHYVSERWEQGWGGELKLFPLGKPAVLVPPKPDRLVVFRSNSMLHRVLPYSADGDVPRVCYSNCACVRACTRACLCVCVSDRCMRMCVRQGFTCHHESVCARPVVRKAPAGRTASGRCWARRPSAGTYQECSSPASGSARCSKPMGIVRALS